MPTIHVIAGPNGVGKTTFADRHLPQTIRELKFVNADLVARGLSPYDPDAAAMDAGRIALRRIRSLIDAGQSFSWETTMSGKTAVAWLGAAREQGYRLNAYFIWVREVETAMDRIRQRVSEGGHNIDPETSRRRFLKTLENFFNVYRPLFETWMLFENDGPAPRLLAMFNDGRLALRDPKRFQHMLAEVKADL